MSGEARAGSTADHKENPQSYQGLFEIEALENLFVCYCNLTENLILLTLPTESSNFPIRCLNPLKLGRQLTIL